MADGSTNTFQVRLQTEALGAVTVFLQVSRPPTTLLGMQSSSASHAALLLPFLQPFLGWPVQRCFDMLGCVVQQCAASACDAHF